jgi:putative spermidine/putrescine transport system permease protein
VKDRILYQSLLLPMAIFFVAFFIIPLGKLLLIGASGTNGVNGADTTYSLQTYTSVLSEPRYIKSMISTVALSLVVTVSTLLISSIAGVFLARNQFSGKSLLTALLTLPLAFPGVVIGFMVIMIGGRQGLLAQLTGWINGEPMVIAYSMTGLFLGYIYFSIPRTILTILAAAEKLDPMLEQAARSLGAGPWRVTMDVVLPALKPALLAAGAICFATSMGAFGTAFTLATKINVIPMTIYTEFTLQANMAVAAALSFVLGFVTWIVLALARNLSGNSVVAAA